MPEQMTNSKPDQKADPIDIDLLIVDDETDFRESACRYLKRIGFRVDEAEDGQIGLGMLEKNTYDIVLCDIKMPKMDGITSASVMAEDVSAVYIKNLIF